MGIIATNKNEIKLYYNSENSLGKQIYAYVTTSDKKVLAIDIAKTKIPGSHWAEIASGLHIPIKELINMQHPDFVKMYGNKNIDLDDNDWLKILEKYPIALISPIILMGDNFYFIKTPSNFIKFMGSYNPDQEKFSR